KVETGGERRICVDTFKEPSHCEFFYFSKIPASRQAVFAKFFRRLWIDKLRCCSRHKICRVRFCGKRARKHGSLPDEEVHQLFVPRADCFRGALNQYTHFPVDKRSVALWRRRQLQYPGHSGSRRFPRDNYSLQDLHSSFAKFFRCQDFL